MGTKQETSPNYTDWDESKIEILEKPKFFSYTTLATSLCDYIEAALLWAGDDYNEKKPNFWLKGNYAPTEEFRPETNLPITGTIPVSILYGSQIFVSFKRDHGSNFPSC